MDAKTKNILKRSIYQYKEVSVSQRRGMLKQLKMNIEQHEIGIEAFGTGYPKHLVQSAKIFLRIFDKLDGGITKKVN